MWDGVSAIAYEKTTRHSAHFTLWGDPREMLKYVMAVVPVTEPGTHLQEVR